MPARPVIRIRLGLIAIVAGALALYLVGNTRVPLLDRDEPRYAECSREMLRSGDWIVPRFLGELRAHKPPLIYWCQAIAMELLGQTQQAARFPSAVAMTLTAALLGMFVWKRAGPRTAFWSVTVFCTCCVTIVGAKLCLTDSVLLLWIAIGQGCLYGIWRNPRPSIFVPALLWLSIALAGLTKGPVVLAAHAATLVVLAILEGSCGWWRKLRPLMGGAILLGLVSPWIILVNQRAPDFLPRLLNRAGRYASSGAEGHAHWPGYYLVIIWGVMFPWSILLPSSIGMGLQRRRRPLVRFALAAAIGPWLVMELVPNKLPLYILPSFPALAVLTAQVIVRRRIWRTAGAMGAGIAAVGLILFAVVLPGIPELEASRSIGRRLNELGAGGEEPVAMIDYREPSLAFYQGGGARETDISALSLPAGPAWAVLTLDAWSQMPPPIRTKYAVVGRPYRVALYNDGWRVTRLVIIRQVGL
jgi:4-amino-4-deoxy-L-arabinose transferase-like glycosyltransferase